MNFEELQRVWRNAKYVPKSEKELRAMMYRRAAPRLRPRKKAIRQFCISMLTLIGLSIAFDFFKDLSSAISTVWAAVFMVDELLGIRYMNLVPEYATIERSLGEFVRRAKRVAVLSVMVHGLMFIISVTAILRMHLDTKITIVWLLSFVCAFVAAVWSSAKKWWNSVSDAQHMLNKSDWEDDEDR